MEITSKPGNVVTLKQASVMAEKGKYAIGSFSPRYTPVIRAVLKAAQKTQSPFICQISQKELERYGISPREFAEEFYAQMKSEKISVPAVLHLDHTKVFSVIEEAISAGFTSVMIDASEKPLEENIQISREVVRYAHNKGVSVEAELGMIGTTDFIETDHDEELYTNPEEAKRFVDETGVDSLAVSVGTAHGVYMVKEPKIDFDRLEAIRSLTPVHLVLHGGSGVPAWMIERAVQLPEGGISKVNIATDLELALLEALGRKERMTNAELMKLSPEELEVGLQAVEATVVEKISDFLGSKGHAADFGL
ncbi:class II fructose-bisphosphate aldolase [Paenibacillus gansuensis]|uniref:Ketose-bisphosphate aldolase n=1 Tax=Paenibacillus gansuensis TaxID=306542 RepID=A0ABW5PBN9_9BACL